MPRESLLFHLRVVHGAVKELKVATLITAAGGLQLGALLSCITRCSHEHKFLLLGDDVGELQGLKGIACFAHALHELAVPIRCPLPTS